MVHPVGASWFGSGQSGVLPMMKSLALLTLLIACGGLGACASDRVGAGSGYVGRFDNDENRRPILVDTARSSPSQNLIYGDGEH